MPDSTLVSLVLLFALTLVFEVGFILLVVNAGEKEKKPPFHPEPGEDHGTADVAVYTKRVEMPGHHSESWVVTVAQPTSGVETNMTNEK